MGSEKENTKTVPFSTVIPMQIKHTLRKRVEQEHYEQGERSQEKETQRRLPPTAEAHNCTQASNEKEGEANMQRDRNKEEKPHDQGRFHHLQAFYHRNHPPMKEKHDQTPRLQLH